MNDGTRAAEPELDILGRSSDQNLGAGAGVIWEAAPVPGRGLDTNGFAKLTEN